MVPLQLNDDLIEQFAQGRVALTDYFCVADAIALDTDAQRKMRDVLQGISSDEERLRIYEIHEAMAAYNARFQGVIRDMLGIYMGGQ